MSRPAKVATTSKAFVYAYVDPINPNLKGHKQQAATQALATQLCFDFWFPRKGTVGCSRGARCLRVHDEAQAEALGLIDRCCDCKCAIKKYEPKDETEAKQAKSLKRRCKSCYAVVKQKRAEARQDKASRQGTVCSADYCNFVLPPGHDHATYGNRCHKCWDCPLRVCPGVLDWSCYQVQVNEQSPRKSVKPVAART
jgi:hypothetical protein